MKAAKGGQIEWKTAGRSTFEAIKITPLRQYALAAFHSYRTVGTPIDSDGRQFLSATADIHDCSPFLNKGSDIFARALDQLLRLPDRDKFVVAPDGAPVPWDPEPLRWASDRS